MIHFLQSLVESKCVRLYLLMVMFLALQMLVARDGEKALMPWLSWNRRQHWLDDYVDLLIDKLSLNLDNMERIKGSSFNRYYLPSSR